MALRRNLTGNVSANGYRMVMRMQLERAQNGFGTDIGWIGNSKGSQKRNLRSLEHMLVNFAIIVLTRDLKMMQF